MKYQNFPVKYILKKLLKPFQKVLSKPQLKHFKTFIKGMIISSTKSIAKFAHFGDQNQCNLNRFMQTKALNEELLKEKVYVLAKNTIDRRSNTYLVFDDFIAHHPYSKKITDVGRHHDHLQKGYSQGHSIFEGGIVNRGTYFPLHSEVYVKKSDVRDSSEFKSKIEMAKCFIEKMVDKFNFDGILFDRWYPDKKLLKLICELCIYFYTMLKSNRKITIKRRNLSLVEHFENLKKKDFKTIQICKKKYKTCTKIGILKGVGRVQIVFSQEYNEKKDEFGDVHFLTTNDLKISTKGIIKTYSSRWPVEVNNRDQKQNLGLENSILRNPISIRRYLLFCNIAQCILCYVKRRFYKLCKTSGDAQKFLRKLFIYDFLKKRGLGKQNLENCVEELVKVL